MLGCAPSQQQWQMEFYRDLPTKTIIILVVTGILGTGGQQKKITCITNIQKNTYFSNLFPPPGENFCPPSIQGEKKEGLTAVLPMDGPDENADGNAGNGNESSSTESSGLGWTGWGWESKKGPSRDI